MNLSELPLVTVMMPIRNEGAFIAQALGAALAQDYPQERLEIIVADGMSTDDTRRIVEEFQAQHAGLRLIDNHGKFVATGLNAALREARGDIIIRADGRPWASALAGSRSRPPPVEPDRLAEARRNGANLPVTALVDQFYAEVEKMGGKRWDTSSLLARLER